MIARPRFISLCMAAVGLAAFILTPAANAFEGTWRYYTVSADLADRYQTRSFTVCTFDGWTVENSGVPELAEKWRERSTRITAGDPDMIEKFEFHMRTQATFCSAYAVPWSDPSKRDALDAAAEAGFTGLFPYEPINSRISASPDSATPTPKFSEERISQAVEHSRNACQSKVSSERNFDCECIAAEAERRMRANEVSTTLSDQSISNAVERDAPRACFTGLGIEERVQKTCERLERYDPPAPDCSCAKTAAIESLTQGADRVSLSDITSRKLIPDAFAKCR